MYIHLMIGHRIYILAKFAAVLLFPYNKIIQMLMSNRVAFKITLTVYYCKARNFLQVMKNVLCG